MDATKGSYLLAQLLGKDLQPLHVSEFEDTVQRFRLEETPQPYLDLWTPEELSWALGLYDGGELSQVRERYLAIERKLEGMPRSEERSALVREMFRMKHG